ncbi:unnamed protein product [Lactuca saligna]|uniref:non-specific serine/threonine protein kinase n=1 Tax=Lactuca saligna TaxID=75948 RepID=A0AA35YLH3_LACSI|nr:unnamed protein product [Lactuca saligna]
MSQMKHSIRLLYIFLVLFIGSVSGSLYEDCAPQHCGNDINISYPFFVGGLQRSYCGYPGFELQCNFNGLPSVLNISGTNYSVNDINFQQKSMRLVHAPTSTCPLDIRNITLDSDSQLVGVFPAGLTSELIFLTECSKEVPNNMTEFRIGSCDPDVMLVMLGDDEHLEMAKELCTNVVVAPVEVPGDQVVVGGNYTEVMKRGFTMSWSAPGCNQCEQSGGRCGWIDSQFRCLCPSSIDVKDTCPVGDTSKKQGRTNKKQVILVTALCVGFVIILVVIILCFLWKLKQRRKTKNSSNVENFLKNHEFLAKRYSYLQVKKMTSSFQVKLGQGGFGCVYRGVLSNGNLVAVKILNKLKGNNEDFINEVASVGKTSHVNIVSLVGFCFEGNKKALIYEFMPNGSLEKFIYNQASSSINQLGWEKLHEIAIGIARGLEYLHIGCNTRILHFDIKPHNILLDQDFSPKISDFGLAKLFPKQRSMISMSRMRGTPGYIAPEVYSRNFGQVSHKSDVYSYGMMILEMVGGKKNIEVGDNHTSEIYFPHWIYKKIELDEELGLRSNSSDKENEMARTMIIVGLWCIQTNPLNRPTITKAIEMLEGDLESLEIPPKPYLSSPSKLVGSSLTD